jgi:RecT family
MNTIVPIKQDTPPIPPMGLVPATMEEAVRLAELMASAKLVPAALQKSPADCLMVIQQAIRWGMDVFAVAQECSVIQGKLMHSGKLVAAVINARGGLAERLAFAYDGEGDDRSITVSGRLSGEVEPREVVVRLRDARTANKVWQTQPDQQLMYHASRVWARRHAPELMLGVYSPEEFDEPAPLSSAAKRPPPPKPNVLLAAPEHDPETGEIAPPAETADDVADWDVALTEAAEHGTEDLQKTWETIPRDVQLQLKSALKDRHKPRAKEVDAVPQS